VLPTTLEGLANDIDEKIQFELGVRSPFVLQDAVVIYSPKIAHASESGIAYLKESDIRPVFDTLADRIQTIAPRRP
jgi:hypothetical protein